MFYYYKYYIYIRFIWQYTLIDMQYLAYLSQKRDPVFITAGIPALANVNLASFKYATAMT